MNNLLRVAAPSPRIALVFLGGVVSAWGPIAPLTAQDRVPSSASPAEVRNVILLLGDGLGPQQLGLLSHYAHYAPHSQVPGRRSAIERLMEEGVVGLMRTEPADALVADSASSATQLATGKMSRNELIGCDADGNAAPTIVEIAHALGKSTGLVSDTRATHATPAAFAAHQPRRLMENEIAADMLDSGVDVLLSGGLRHWIPQGVNDRKSAAYESMLQMVGGAYAFSSKRNDNRNLVLEAREDYQLAFDRSGLARVERGRVLGLFAESDMLDALALRAALSADQRTEPTLLEMAEKAIELLDQNRQGFFLLIEGGQIDWAGHNNDVGTMLHELLRFDECVRAVAKWARDRDDTLLVVTGDHETGGFGFSYSGRPLPSSRRLPGDRFREIEYSPNFNFGEAATLDRIYDQPRSFYAIFREFDQLPADQRTPDRLCELVNDDLSFSITIQDAVDILARTPNASYAEGHPYLAVRTVPRVNDFSDFFVFGENSRMNLLGRKIAGQQNVVWGTATHTATPTPLIAWGPEQVARRFSGMPHSTRVGRLLIELINGESAN